MGERISGCYADIQRGARIRSSALVSVDSSFVFDEISICVEHRQGFVRVNSNVLGGGIETGIRFCYDGFPMRSCKVWRIRSSVAMFTCPKVLSIMDWDNV